MTPKIRIGNDIVIRATVLRLGQPEDFTGKEVRLWLCGYSTRTELPFTLNGNELTATWYGTEQTLTGTYRLTIELRHGDRSLNTADECAAFQLVPRSCAEDCLTGTQHVSARLDVGTQTRDIDLSISTPANGLSAYELALRAGFQGTEAEWLASLKGEPGESRALFIEQWNNAAGRFGRYNPDTDLFELNGLTDITWPQAYDIFRYTAGQGFDTEGLYRGMKIRTNLPMRLPDYSDSLHWFCYGCTEMEVVRIFGGYGQTSDFVAQDVRLSFFNCTKLRAIYGVIQFLPAFSGVGGNTTDMFYACRDLEEVKIKNLNVNMDCKYLQKLSLECFEYMVANALAKNPITITVHPDVYAKITDEGNAEWHALIAAAQAKQITFQTA